MHQSKRILICPLNWGLGHATRCIPIIRLLLEKNAEVIIAADGRPLELLKKEFPQLKFIEFKGYDIEYPQSGSMAWKILLSIPKILNRIKTEQTELEKIVEQHKIDIVISDNRYGCYSKNAKSVFITHQLMVKSPAGEKVLHNKILSYIKKYAECWIPDNANENNLSGDLSHKYSKPSNAYFIGPLSRFKLIPTNTPKYDIMAIVSGPEPQRTIFEQLIIKQASELNYNTLIVCGKPENNFREKKENVEIIAHLNANEMEKAILHSKIIVCRSGYSSIMDLAALNKKAIFISTPGQTEQEYLAKYLYDKKIAFYQTQNKFDLKEAIERSNNFSGFIDFKSSNLLEERINLLVS